MLRYARIPLLFLFVGSLLGIFLRWQFITPTPGVNYSFFLHGHSHIMFLGWIFNALYIGIVHNHIEINKGNMKFFKSLFIIIQIFVVGMLISFPLQGYGFYSIVFSTLHSVCVIVFIIRFFTKTKYLRTVSVWYARIALIFFVISIAGPFSLGYLMSTGMGQSNWYYFSIYFYLHFQYNGFFLFGVFSLFFSLLEKKMIAFNHVRAKTFGWITAATCLSSYFLSVLWAMPGLVFNIGAGLSAVVQLFAISIFVDLLMKCLSKIRTAFDRWSVYFLSFALAAFVLKSLLQVSSAFPAIAQMAYELRPIVIAYLHLVLIGVISVALFVWYLESNLLDKRSGTRIIVLFLTSFCAHEICLTLSPWRKTLFGGLFFSASHAILFFSVILSLASLLLLLSFHSELIKSGRESTDA